MNRVQMAKHIYGLIKKGTYYSNFKEFYENYYSEYVEDAYNALENCEKWEEFVTTEISGQYTKSGNPVIVNWDLDEIRTGMRLSVKEWKQRKLEHENSVKEANL